MPTKPETEAGEVIITVDGGEFFSFVRAMKRGFRADDLGDVVMSVRGSNLTIETVRGGSVLPCTPALPVTARVHGGSFLRLVHLATDAKVSGPLVIVFRPEFGEVALPHAAAKATFDRTG